MNIANYKIAKQVGTHGIYGEIELTFEFTSEHLKVNLSVPENYTRWYSGILFGATYWLEHTIQPLGLNLYIREIKFNEVDTNNTVIAYLTTKALEHATKTSLKGSAFFDEQTVSFVFKK
jgi:hypothetical protein